MRGVYVGLLMGGLVLGPMALPAWAGGWHHGHHHHHGHGHFFGGFFAGAATVLIVDALATPRVVYAPPPAYFGPAYYRAPVCRDVQTPDRWELRARDQNGFITYYHVWVPGSWRRECY
jgi:hypothetical protein